MDYQKTNATIAQLKQDPSTKGVLEELYSKDCFFEDLFTYAMEDMKLYGVKKVSYDGVIEVGLSLLEQGYSEDDILYDLELFFQQLNEFNKKSANDT